jgi:hypothetical protein
MAAGGVYEQAEAAPDHVSPTAETVEKDAALSDDIVASGAPEYKAEFEPTAVEAQEDLRSFARIHMVFSS